MVLCRCWHKLKIQKNYQTNKKMKGEREMRVIKRSKILALALSLAMLICAMPMMASADDALVEIKSIVIVQDPQNEELLDVTVEYDVAASVGDQITLLATTTSYDVQFDGDEVTNIAYIDQIAKPAAPAEGFRSFNFKIVKADLGEDNRLYVKIGGTGINTPATFDEEFDEGGTTIFYGDVNGDGEINAADASLVLQRFVGTLASFPAGEDIVGDVNGDGEVNAADASLILQYFVGTLEILPVYNK